MVGPEAELVMELVVELAAAGMCTGGMTGESGDVIGKNSAQAN
jgi:hypothetical protein